MIMIHNKKHNNHIEVKKWDLEKGEIYNVTDKKIIVYYIWRSWSKENIKILRENNIITDYFYIQACNWRKFKSKKG